MRYKQVYENMCTMTKYANVLHYSKDGHSDKCLQVDYIRSHARVNRREIKFDSKELIEYIFLNRFNVHFRDNAYNSGPWVCLFSLIPKRKREINIHYYYYFKLLTPLDSSKPIQKRISVNHEGLSTPITT